MVPRAANASHLLLTRGLQARENSQCVVQILGTEINTSSFALYTFSISVLVQALVLVSISAIADHGMYEAPGFTLSY